MPISFANTANVILGTGQLVLRSALLSCLFLHAPFSREASENALPNAKQAVYPEHL